MVVHKIIYPNGEIYVEQDRTDALTDLRSVNSRPLEANFPPERRRDFTIRKEILWQSDTADRSEINQKEIELILTLNANDPTLRYNRWPKFRGTLEPPKGS